MAIKKEEKCPKVKNKSQRPTLPQSQETYKKCSAKSYNT